MRFLILVLLGSCSAERFGSPPRDIGPKDAASEDSGGLDASPDAGDASSTDAGEPVDGGVTATACPDRSEYVGDAWPDEVEIAAGDVLLADAVEAATLDEVRSLKARLSIAPGRYAIPSESGSYMLRLPLCLDLGDGSAPMIGPIGDALSNPSGTQIYVHLTQHLEVDGEQDWIVTVYIQGEPNNLSVGGGSLRRADNTDHRRLLSNRFPGYDGRRHTITFDGGSLTSEFWMAWGGTPSSGLIVRATGEIDGTAFDQADYWKLVNNYQHHFFGADWAVLFDAPIGGACGLRVDFGDPLLLFSDPAMTVLSTIDCDLVSLEQRTISDQTTEPL